MTSTYKFYNNCVESTSIVMEDGSLKEVDGYRMCFLASHAKWNGPGTVFSTIDAWVSAMVAEAEKRMPWHVGRHTHKLSFQPADAAKRSSVVWVASKKHYMEVRRGSQTKFTATEKRYWLSLREWVIATAGAKEAVAEAVASDPFDSKAFKEAFVGLKEWIEKQTDPHTYSAGIVQTTTWLLEATASADASAWLKKNPAWRYSARAIIQAYGWKAVHKEATEAVVAFLEKF